MACIDCKFFFLKPVSSSLIVTVVVEAGTTRASVRSARERLPPLVLTSKLWVSSTTKSATMSTSKETANDEAGIVTWSTVDV